jgi:hypothetical protein
MFQWYIVPRKLTLGSYKRLSSPRSRMRISRLPNIYTSGMNKVACISSSVVGDLEQPRSIRGTQSGIGRLIVKPVLRLVLVELDSPPQRKLNRLEYHKLRRLCLRHKPGDQNTPPRALSRIPHLHHSRYRDPSS